MRASTAVSARSAARLQRVLSKAHMAAAGYDSDGEGKPPSDDAFFRANSTRRLGLDKTWSVAGFGSSSVMFYDDDSDDSDDDSSDDDSSAGSTDDDVLFVLEEDEEEDEDEDEDETKQKASDTTKKKNDTASKPSSRDRMLETNEESTSHRYESSENDDDDFNDDNSYTASHSASASSPSVPVSNGGSSPRRTKKKSGGEKKKKKSASSKKKGKKKGKERHKIVTREEPPSSLHSSKGSLGSSLGSGLGSSVGSSIASVDSSQDDDIVAIVTDDILQAREEVNITEEKDVVKPKKKKKKKKGKTKKGKKKKGKKKNNKKRAVISFVVENEDEDPFELFDKQLQEIEIFEASLIKDKLLLQKEREAMAFELESMEMRLDEEVEEVENLKYRVKELEQLVQSQKISHAGNKVDDMNQRETMKAEFQLERNELTKQLDEKTAEIEELKKNGNSKKKEGFTFFNPRNEGKSRDRLQGDLLQITAKLSEKEAKLGSTEKELETVREELIALRDKNQVDELRASLKACKEGLKTLTEKLEDEKVDNAKKLRDKDETVTFLMNELARLKKEQSIMTRR